MRVNTRDVRTDLVDLEQLNSLIADALFLLTQRLTSDPHLDRLTQTRIRILQMAVTRRAQSIQNWSDEIDRTRNHRSLQQLQEEIVSLLLPPDEANRSFFDDIADCTALLPPDDGPRAMARQNALMKLKIAMKLLHDAIVKIYQPQNMCVAIFDMVGSQGIHTTDIDLAMGYMHRKLKERAGVEVQDLRPGDDEIIAFFDSEKNATETAIHFFDDLIDRLNSIMLHQINFRCAIYTSHLYRVRGKLRGEAIVYAARLLRFTDAGTIAVSEATHGELRRDLPYIKRRIPNLTILPSKKQNDKHGIPHRYYILNFKVAHR